MQPDLQSDISVDLAKILVYAGKYTPQGANRDFSDREKGGAMHVNTDELKIEIQGTISLAYEFVEPFHINRNSEISFDVTLGDRTEILAICLNDDLKPKREGDGRAISSCLVIGGTAVEEYNETDVLKHFNPQKVKMLENQAAENVSHSVTYFLKDLFPSVTSSIRYIGFVQVNDAILSESSESFIHNLKIEDASTRRRRLLTTPLICEPDELFASNKAGLQSDEGEFCVSSEIMLQQIEKDEGEFCSNDHQCRSGTCTHGVCVSKVSENHRLFIRTFTQISNKTPFFYRR